MNKVALITGAGKGIGRGIALRFSEEGADIAINYNTSQEAAQELCKQIISMQRNAIAIRADVSKEDEVRNMIEKVATKFGKIDILVNNAGIAYGRLIVDTTIDDWNRLFDVNVRGVYLCCKYAIPYLAKVKGTIINMASEAGKTGGKYYAAYCASKFAVIGLTQSLAAEFAEYCVRVNAICPSWVRTDMMRRDWKTIGELKGRTASEVEREMLDQIPLHRISEPEEIGDLAVFLASDKASYITGEAINITGGSEFH